MLTAFHCIKMTISEINHQTLTSRVITATEQLLRSLKQMVKKKKSQSTVFLIKITCIKYVKFDSVFPLSIGILGSWKPGLVTKGLLRFVIGSLSLKC